MARARKNSKKQDYSKYLSKALKRTSSKASSQNPEWFNKIKTDLNSKQSPTNLLLGAVIVIVLAVLVFNFFNKQASQVSPQTASQATQPSQDVSKNNLPGKYTVKDGDTLFSIAQSYYNNGYLYPKIADENKLSDPDSITPGQVLQIPKVDTSTSSKTQYTPGGVGGASNQTAWGEAITGDTYTVKQDDWLSKIAGRAYGDIFAFDKIAKANNIQNPDLIEVGMVLKIPR